MIIHNHLNITGPVTSINTIADAFITRQPFATLHPLKALERQTVEAIECQREKAWSTPHEAFRSKIIDLFDHSLAVEFWTTNREPEEFIRHLARTHPQISGVCQFMSDGRSLARSGTMKIGAAKVFTRSYINPRKAYA